MTRITKTAGLVLFLLRLVDNTKSATLSKLKGTVHYSNFNGWFRRDEDNTLGDRIWTAFHNRVDELECNIVNVAYVLDPQYVTKSRFTTVEVIISFWKVARNFIMKVEDEEEWRCLKIQLVTELTQFSCGRIFRIERMWFLGRRRVSWPTFEKFDILFDITTLFVGWDRAQLTRT